MKKIPLYAALLIFIINSALVPLLGEISEPRLNGLAGILICAYLLIRERENND